MYHVAPNVAVGLHAGWGSGLGARGLASSTGDSIEQGQDIWQLALAGRYQAEAGRSWYLCGEGGVAAIVDSIGDDSVTQWAPLVAATLGHDFRIARPFALALELRLGHAWFTEQGRALVIAEGLGEGTTLYGYDATTWLGLNLVGRFLL